jgi:hypothetical protein
MLRIDIPDFVELNLEHVVMDYKGTMAVDGEPIQGIR